jgi:hypothetical protein
MKLDELEAVLSTRTDLSPYLLHFTRRSADGSGFDVLKSILKDGYLKGSTRFVRGSEPVVSLMEAPLPALKVILAKENWVRYEPYGLALQRSYVYSCGGRPVLYLSNSEEEKLKIPKKQLWRVIRLEYKKREEDTHRELEVLADWTHEREWRCPGRLKLPNNPIVFVWTSKEAHTLSRLRLGGVRPGAILPLQPILAML